MLELFLLKIETKTITFLWSVRVFSGIVEARWKALSIKVYICIQALQGLIYNSTFIYQIMRIIVLTNSQNATLIVLIINFCVIQNDKTESKLTSMNFYACQTGAGVSYECTLNKASAPALAVQKLPGSGGSGFASPVVISARYQGPSTWSRRFGCQEVCPWFGRKRLNTRLPVD